MTKIKNATEQKAYKAAVRAIWESLDSGFGEPFKDAEYPEALYGTPERLTAIEALVIADIKKLTRDVG